MARRALILFLALLFLFGCAGPGKKTGAAAGAAAVGSQTRPSRRRCRALVRLPADQHPAFYRRHGPGLAGEAIEKSLQYYSRAAGDGPRRMDDALVTVRELRESLIALREILRRDEPDAVKQVRIRETFDVYQSTGLDGKNTVLFTGYFEPIMNGSLTKTERYRYPIYRAPDDAVVVNLGEIRRTISVRTTGRPGEKRRTRSLLQPERDRRARIAWRVGIWRSPGWMTGSASSFSIPRAPARSNFRTEGFCRSAMR